MYIVDNTYDLVYFHPVRLYADSRYHIRRIDYVHIEVNDNFGCARPF